MATTAPSTTAQQANREKFHAERATYGGITYLTLGGTLNVDFIGKKVAKAIKTKKIVINMRSLRRYASWGMSEWMEFLRIHEDSDLYIVECSAYALSQLNLINSLLGHAKLVSYYASFRCGKCGEEIETQFIVPRDRDRIRELPRTHQECTTCGGRAQLEEYPAAFFETIADRPPFDIDDEVLAFFRGNLRYDIAPDLTRFRAYRAVKSPYTYLRLSGNLDALPPEMLAKASEGTTVVDLEHLTFQPDRVEAWQLYVAAAIPRVDSLQLLHCPPGFLESAVLPEHLRSKVKVRTFALPYDCFHCERSANHMIDVADNLEHLAEGTAPTVRCPTCRASLVAAINMQQAMLLRTLPARDRDANLDKFLAASREKPMDKLENCLVPSAAKAVEVKPTSSRGLFIALGASTVLVACLAVIGFWLWKDRGAKQQIVTNPGENPTPTGPTFTRPDWIVSQVPSSAYCHDMINRLMCVGVSAYRASKEDGVTEASDAALEELVNAVALKISDPFFRESVMPQYTDSRAKVLSALQTADLDRKTDPAASAAYAKADESVRSARKRVVEMLFASGGAAVPTQRSDWYWEEYAGENGKPNEILVFVRYDVSLDAVRSLVEAYSATTTVLGTSAMTAFPALGWRYTDFTGGAILTKVSRHFAEANIAPQSIVVAIGDQKITDAAAFGRHLETSSHSGNRVKLTVRAKDAAAPQEIETKP